MQDAIPLSQADAQPISLVPESKAKEGQRSRVLRRFLRHRMAVLGTLLLTGIILYIGIGSIIFSEADSNYNDTKIKLQEPSDDYLFGTDTIGRDVMARTIYGGQISLIIGFFAMLVGVTVGTLVGALSGFYGGWLDALLMRATEAMLSIPTLLVLLVTAKFMGHRIQDVNVLGRAFSGSVVVIILIIGFTSWMTLSRLVRANVLSLKEQEFVVAARALGASNRRLIMSHILPNTMAPIIVSATLGIGSAIITEAYISYLGLGVQAPSASWGNMLTNAQRYIERAPWLWIAPGTLIVLTVLSINYIGDGLRDALDPQSDKRI